mmetsp:Transcript_31097/g.57457  ORF Transcript_31097/g.57457 Transcript_31097/m.57457 type:complete len:141 (-) Transcript_31097:334-756(-)
MRAMPCGEQAGPELAGWMSQNFIDTTSGGKSMTLSLPSLKVVPFDIVLSSDSDSEMENSRLSSQKRLIISVADLAGEDGDLSPPCPEFAEWTLQVSVGDKPEVSFTFSPLPSSGKLDPSLQVSLSSFHLPSAKKNSRRSE